MLYRVMLLETVKVMRGSGRYFLHRVRNRKPFDFNFDSAVYESRRLLDSQEYAILKIEFFFLDYKGLVPLLPVCFCFPPVHQVLRPASAGEAIRGEAIPALFDAHAQKAGKERKAEETDNFARFGHSFAKLLERVGKIRPVKFNIVRHKKYSSLQQNRRPGR